MPELSFLTALSLFAMLAYGLLAYVQQSSRRGVVPWAWGLAWGLHGAALCWGWLAPAPKFGFGPALSLTAWLVLMIHALEGRLYPQLMDRWPLAALGAVAVGLGVWFPGSAFVHLSSSWLPLHWALGMAAYGLIAVAVVHAFWMQRAERAMRQGLGQGVRVPLLTLERLTFGFVGAGFALLTATLVAGMWFSGAAHMPLIWNHKTVLSVLAWLTMGLLLLGRWRLGWRGRLAARTLYVGAGLLLLGYVGSRFVLEVLLHRA